MQPSYKRWYSQNTLKRWCTDVPTINRTKNQNSMQPFAQKYTKRIIRKDVVHTAAYQVIPIKNSKDIAKIKQYLYGKKNRRDYYIFVIGINVGLRASDLLRLKWDDVLESGVIKDEVTVREKKTGKLRTFALNDAAKACIAEMAKTTRAYEPDQYLFISRKGINSPLTVRSLNKIITDVTNDLGIKGNYGTHSLRKTFAFHVYESNIAKNPGILTVLMKMLNHSSEQVTLRYIGIMSSQITNVYMSLNL